jgi:leucyl-tRNA synthetase
VVGARKFLEKVFGLAETANYQTDAKIISLLHKTIKKVTEDIESFRLNTAISAMMILANEVSDYKIKNNALPFGQADFLKFIQILAPFAPHLSEEIWENLKQSKSIFLSTWPAYDADKIKDETFNLIIQVNGKLRASLEVAAGISESDAFILASAQENVQKWLADKEIVKKIFVPGKLLNIVVK